MTTRRHFLQLLAILPVITALGCRDDTTFKILPKGSKVCALGDSLTFGYGAKKGEDYPSRLAALTGWQIENAGVSGDTTANVLARLEGVLASSPKLVLLGVGGNDVLRRVPNDETYQNLLAIVNRLKNASIDTILIAEPHLSMGALFGSLSDNPVYQKVADETKVPLLADVWSKILSDDSLKSDQIHANAQGYAKFADTLYEFLKQLGYV